MKSLILNPNEAKNIDQLRYLVRPMKKVGGNVYWNQIVVNGYGGWVDEHGNPFPPPFLPGETVFVKERWADLRGMGFSEKVGYLADCLNKYGKEDEDSKRCREDFGVKYHSPAIMPQWASRYEITFGDVEAKQLHDLRLPDTMFTLKNKWEEAYPKFPWDSNPWLWKWKVEVKHNGR